MMGCLIEAKWICGGIGPPVMSCMYYMHLFPQPGRQAGLFPQPGRQAGDRSPISPPPLLTLQLPTLHAQSLPNQTLKHSP